MMETAIVIMVLVETLVLAVVMAALPWLGRRRLLLGVYVGEQRSQEPDATAIKRAWLGWTFLATVASLALAFAAQGTRVAALAAELAPLVLFVVLGVGYLRCHARARRLARPLPPAAAAGLAPPSPSALPWVALAVGIVLGVACIAYAVHDYPELPERIPTHFGPSGQPDAWSRKSFASVMTLPLMTLVLGVGLSGMALLADHAKRSVRSPDPGGRSLAAQERFRRFMVAWLCVIAVLSTLLVAVISIGSIRVAAGAASSLGPAPMIGAGIILLASLGGVALMAIRFGQGGARLEGAAAEAPLTDGMADNTSWRWGLFYVDRHDPAIFIEKRFGLGYTINFGNPKAVALLAGFVAVVLGLALLPVVLR